MRRFHNILTFFVFSSLVFQLCLAQNKSSYHIRLKNKSNDEKTIANTFIQSTQNSKSPISFIDKKTKNSTQITFYVNPKQNFDYRLNKVGSEIVFEVKSKKIGFWLNFQLLGLLDNKNDNILKPYINFSPTEQHFAFNYREAHFYSNTLQENQNLFGAHHLENEWGIWGHNLNKVLKQYRDKSMWAYINGKRNPKQWSFASPKLFDALCSYIDNNFKTRKKFMIMPNDNGLVCQDPRSLKLGNTKKDAGPSVHYLIRKLALKYPQHQFFTSDYGCVKSPPKEKLPQNCGVIISTMSLPKGVSIKPNNKSRKFQEKIKQWTTKCSSIYLWDYACNFDDYLSPFPKAYAFQKQIGTFKSWGVNGLFVNGSGYQYSLFEDIDSYVLNALMIKPSLNIDQLVNNYCTYAYPELAKPIAQFYINTEKKQALKNKPLSIYTGINQAQQHYLDEAALLSLKKQIEKILVEVSFKKRKKYTKIHAALSFSVLQLALNGFKNKQVQYEINPQKPLPFTIKKCYYDLKKYQQLNVLSNFKEAGGSLTQFLKEFESLVLRKRFQKKSLLIHKKVKNLHRLDEGYQNTTSITDGLFGFSNDYHRGWLISSLENPIWEIPFSPSNKTHTLKLHFMDQAKLRIKLPEKIEIYLNKRLYKTLTNPSVVTHNLNRATYTSTINFSGVNDLKVKIFRNLKSKKIACDEIELF